MTDRESQIVNFQRNEISEYLVYGQLARMQKVPGNREALAKISAEELEHYHLWQKYTKREIGPAWLKVWWYLFLARIFGVTFAVKLMENGEKQAQVIYGRLKGTIPEIEAIIAEESGHEKAITALIDESRLQYIGAIVLGMNDALVELTGTLAGLTFALQNEKLVGVAGLITGVAAALSMAASEYLSIRADLAGKNALQAAVYTGITYIIVVVILVLPFLLLSNPFIALAMTLFSTIVMIYIFTFYFAVVRDVSFKRHFAEMAAISLGVAFISFLIGLAIRQFLGISV